MAASKAKVLPQPEEALAMALAAAAAQVPDNGIGTLAERTLHRTLKFWLEPDERRHEVPVGGCVADIFDGETVMEVQTGSLYPLQKKLAALLPLVPVTVVVPLVREKWLCWIDPETGERTAPRRSPKKGAFLHALPELAWVREFWQPDAYTHPLSVRLLLMDMEEMRLRDGWGQDGKRGSHRVDRRPLAIAGEQWVRCDGDVAALLPLWETPFTRKELARAIGKQGMALNSAVRLLERCGAMERVGKQGRTILFGRTKQETGEQKYTTQSLQNEKQNK